MQKPSKKDLIFAGFDISIKVSQLSKILVSSKKSVPHLSFYRIAINFHNKHPHQLLQFEEVPKTRDMASKIPPFLILAIFSAILGMFQFGFNTGVINAPQVS